MNKMLKNIFNKLNASPSIKAAFWFTIASVLQKSISLITMPIFTRLLTPEQYGIFSLYNSWMAMFLIIASLYLWAGVFNNGMIKYEEDRDRFISTIQGLSTVTVIGTLGLYFIFKDFFNGLTGLPTLLMALMFVQIFFTPSFLYWSTKERFEFKYRKLVFFTLIMSVLNPILGLMAIYFMDDNGQARILSIVIVQVLFGGYFYVYNAWKGKSFFNKKYWKFAIAFNIPLIPHYFSQIILNQVDIIMIDKLVDTFSAGIYSVAYATGTVLLFVIGSINSSLVPWIYNNLKEKNYKSIYMNTNYLIVGIGVMLLLFILVSPELTKLFAPPEYYDAIWVIPPITLSLYFIFLYSLFANIEFYFEENKFIMVASVIAAVVNIILNFIFIPIYGYLAAGYTTLLCYMIYAYMHYRFMLKVCKKNAIKESVYNMKVIFYISLTLLLVSGLIMVIYEFTWIRYLTLFTVLLIVVFNKNLIITKITKIKQ